MIFGRHPAVIIGFLQALLFAASEFWLHWSDVQIMGLVAVLVIVGDAIVAYKTVDTLLGFLVPLFKAGAAALILFGVPISDTAQVVLISLITAFVAMLQMNATSPVVGKGSFALAA